MNKSLVTLIPLAFLFGCSPASESTDVSTDVRTEQAKVISKTLPKDAINEATYTANVIKLASDEFGGRAPGTKGEELTVNLLVSEFTSLGLSPGNGDSFTQSVPLTSVEVINSPALVFTDSEGQQVSLTYGTEQVI